MTDNPSKSPFIYIAALRRTGSTVLSESLTAIPDSFIFREPKLGRKRFTVKASDAELFMEHGIDLNAFSRQWSRVGLMDRLFRRNRMMEAFKRDLMPQLLGVVRQVGVKEIHHVGWQYYSKLFPEMKVVLTGRDPRDIFVSTHYRVLQGKDRFRRGFSAKELARDLNRDFSYQKSMFSKHSSMKIRYEDLCENKGRIDEIKTFVGSTIKGIGQVGQFNAANPQRTEEVNVHGGAITSTRVARWRQETDKEILREAQRTFDLMPEFVEFWGYDR